MKYGEQADGSLTMEPESVDLERIRAGYGSVDSSAPSAEEGRMAKFWRFTMEGWEGVPGHRAEVRVHDPAPIRFEGRPDAAVELLRDTYNARATALGAKRGIDNVSATVLHEVATELGFVLAGEGE